MLGGARSGKSRYAETQLEMLDGPLVYIATSQIFDEEMGARIAEHQARRSDRWQTVEAPIDLVGGLAEATGRPVLVDCLTLWLTNLMLGEHNIPAAIANLEAALAMRSAPTILVANEVGLGIVPDHVLARRFRDEAGRLNQRLAAQAESVVFVAAGLPLILKGSR